MKWIQDHPEDYAFRTNNGLQVLWVTPLRALANDTENALRSITAGLDIPWEIMRQTGDTSGKNKELIRRNPPEVLITTPESLHVMMARKGYPNTFRKLHTIIVDEWHELLGSKRGVQTELAISRLQNLRKSLRIWGISATIAHMEEAKKALLASQADESKSRLVHTDFNKPLKIKSIPPDDVESFPWAGHIGDRLIPKIYPIIQDSRSTYLLLR